MTQRSPDSASHRLPQDVATLAMDDFAPLFGETFEAIGADNAAVPLVLENGKEHPDLTLPNAPRKAFSLRFSGPLDGPCLDSAGPYILCHATAGALPPLSMTRVVPPPRKPTRGLLSNRVQLG